MLLTRDEERNLPRALTSLPRGMHVLVIDAHSDDHTVEYARAAGATVIERAWTNFVEARRFALSQVKTPWALMLDADEALDDVLCRALREARDTVDGYMVRRTTYFAGKPMRVWAREPLLRLVRVDRCTVEARPVAGGDAALHERLVTHGATAELPGTLLHYSYPDADSYRSKFARYTSIEARGVSIHLGAVIVALLLVLPRFAKLLVARGALLDGPRGWYVAWFSALYPFVVAAKAIGYRA